MNLRWGKYMAICFNYYFFALLLKKEKSSKGKSKAIASSSSCKINPNIEILSQASAQILSSSLSSSEEE